MTVQIPAWLVYGVGAVLGVAVIAYVAIWLYDRWQYARFIDWWWTR